MNLDLAGLRDPHLNVFYSYGDKPGLENNVTKAFVNVFESFNGSQLKETVRRLFEFELPEGKYSTAFYLQRKPEEAFVRSYPNRIMFAFSPTGKSRGFEGLDTKDEKEIRKVLEAEAKKRTEIEEEQKDYVEYTLNEIRKVRQNRGSIPDGWIFIDVDDKPEVVIAMENKLYDLDPYQLNNHIEKSLYITENKPKPIYRKYEDILVVFKELNTFLSNQFIDYLIILNYAKVDDFSLACSIDKQLRQKQALKFGKEILDLVHDGEKDYRSWNIARCHVNYDYLHEINLAFHEDSIELWLSFGPTQNSAREMLSRIDKIEIKDPRFRVFLGFHLLYFHGKILNGLYVSDWQIDEFIEYWKRNIDLVKTSTPKEATQLYQKMYEDGKINKELLAKATERLRGKKSKILVVPEISLVFKWTYEEAAELGIEKFAKEVKSEFQKALQAMKLA